MGKEFQMRDLQDYAGPFDPNLRYEDFSKETLAKLVEEFAMALQILEGNWHRILRERFGDAATIEMDITQWVRSSPRYHRRISKLLNIQGSNMETIFKALQMDPAFSPGFFDIEWELVDANRGYFTVKNCGPLNAFEKEGRGYEAHICHDLEIPTFTATLHYYNPKAKITPIKLPPRRSEDDIACKWEITIEQ
jgi:hypothetical protein